MREEKTHDTERSNGFGSQLELYGKPIKKCENEPEIESGVETKSEERTYTGQKGK